mmetsp:Transcript_10451/g.28580  ORF Transcript_10451/g.28580 Transcript_10451/m.28580 type:complete len:251 (-) Transcript_10451:1895-2647(-)
MFTLKRLLLLERNLDHGRSEQPVLEAEPLAELFTHDPLVKLVRVLAHDGLVNLRVELGPHARRDLQAEPPEQLNHLLVQPVVRAGDPLLALSLDLQLLLGQVKVVDQRQQLQQRVPANLRLQVLLLALRSLPEILKVGSQSHKLVLGRLQRVLEGHSRFLSRLGPKRELLQLGRQLGHERRVDHAGRSCRCLLRPLDERGCHRHHHILLGPRLLVRSRRSFVYARLGLCRLIGRLRAQHCHLVEPLGSKR